MYHLNIAKHQNFNARFFAFLYYQHDKVQILEQVHYNIFSAKPGNFISSFPASDFWYGQLTDNSPKKTGTNFFKRHDLLFNKYLFYANNREWSNSVRLYQTVKTEI